MDERKFAFKAELYHRVQEACLQYGTQIRNAEIWIFVTDQIGPEYASTFNRKNLLQVMQRIRRLDI